MSGAMLNLAEKELSTRRFLGLAATLSVQSFSVNAKKPRYLVPTPVSYSYLSSMIQLNHGYSKDSVS